MCIWVDSWIPEVAQLVFGYGSVVLNSRTQPLSGRVHRGLEPSMRWREKELVRVYAGAAASISGVLQGLPKCSNITCACWLDYTSQSMGVKRVSFGNIGSTKRSRLESGSSREGSRVDVGAFDGIRTTGAIDSHIDVIR